MHSALKFVTERLPHVEERAALLYESDEDFRELCDEYGVCSETAMRMESDPRSNAALRNEYATLRLRLEGELLRYLAEHPMTDSKH